MKQRWGLVAAAAALILGGCGSDGASLSAPAERLRTETTVQAGQARSDPQTTRVETARFTERSVFGTGADAATTTIRGAFDWRANQGWLLEDGFGGDREVIQVGDRCYRRFDGGRWSASTVSDADLGFCDVELQNPADTVELIEAVASEWSALEPTLLRGLLLSRYQATLNVGAVEGPFEIWIDDRGRVHRFVQRSDESDEGFVSVTDYTDFGAAIDVEPPAPFR